MARLVTWNCNGALRRKHDLLDELDADILVIQECEDPLQYGPDYLEWAGSYLWIGDLRSKGMGVFSRKGHSLTPLSWQGSEFRLFLPVRVGQHLDILGVWTQAARPASAGYIGQFWRFLQSNISQFRAQTVICGDFNSNQIWDKARETGNHGHCVNVLGELELCSVYHSKMMEEHGKETTPTFFMYRKPERAFHLDYVFAHREIVHHADCAVKIGDPDVWLKLRPC